MVAMTARQCGLRLGLAVAAIFALSVAAPAMAQAGAAGPISRTAQETAADLNLVLDRHLVESRCEDPATELMRSYEPVIAQLSGTAILYAIPCIVGAYNIAYRLYRRETGEIGGVETLYFATWSGEFGWGGTDLLFNIEAEGPRLSAFFKSRGLGDCGTDAQWVWRDYGFRLLRFAAQDDCQGVLSQDWPVIFDYAAQRPGSTK